jgi:hypothetical protein
MEQSNPVKVLFSTLCNNIGSHRSYTVKVSTIHQRLDEEGRKKL